MKNKEWLVQIKGEKCSSDWEISVIHIDNNHGRLSWGWFDENKILVSHNGGHCRWPIPEFVWNRQIKIAEDLAEYLNNGNKLKYK